MVRTSESATSSRRSERMVTLLAILREHGEVQLRDIATTLGTSVATIRRDVAVLAEQGLLIRTHGGARSTGPDGELPVNLRDGRHHQAKQAIARTAVAELPRGRHAIALTGGTTTAEVVRALHHRHDLTIVTNSVTPMPTPPSTRAARAVPTRASVDDRATVGGEGGLTDPFSPTV